MNFDLTADQELLQQSVRRLLDDTYAFEQRKNYLKSARGWSPEVWRQFAEMGLLALPFSADEGGFGGGAVDTMLILESLGRVLSLEPYFSSVILAGTALKQGADSAQRARWLPSLMDGSRLYALAHVERAARYDLSHVRTRAERRGDAWCLSGAKDFVIHGDSADRLLVSARHSQGDADRDGISVFMLAAESVRRRNYRSQDGICLADISFDNVMVAETERIGALGSGMTVIDATIDTGVAALVAEAVGAMERALELTVDYLKVRKQFGVAIGSFQTLQHRAVDMLVMIEQARSLAMYAGVMSEHLDAAQRRQATSAAKSFIGRAGLFVGEQSVQLHGGIGMTEDCAIGHYYRRLTMINLLFGDAAHHLSQVSSGGSLP